MTQGRWSRVRLASFTPASIVILMAGTALLLGSFYLDATYFLELAGFPADRLYHPRVQGDLALIRVMGGLIAIILVSSQAILWVRPDAGRTFYAKVEALVRSAGPSFVPLSLAILVLTKTVLQVTLFVFGYALYEADDFARAIKSDYLAQRHALAPGSDLGYWVMVKDSHQLPFADYLFGLGLAIYRDLYLTPKIVNVIVSSGAVIAVYLLGRELFGRMAGLLTAALFAFLPWTVWLGMSGMPSDLPSVLLISLFGLFLFRWLQSNEPAALLTAAVFLALANGFRYENWIYSGVFSLLLVWSMTSQWRGGRLQPRTIVGAICALMLVNAFPVIYMAVFVLHVGRLAPRVQGGSLHHFAECRRPGPNEQHQRPRSSVRILSVRTCRLNCWPCHVPETGPAQAVPHLSSSGGSDILLVQHDGQVAAALVRRDRQISSVVHDTPAAFWRVSVDTSPEGTRGRMERESAPDHCVRLCAGGVRHRQGLQLSRA